MMIKLDHIGIAVSDLDSALGFYVDTLGLKCTHVEEVPDQKVKIAFIPAGDVNLELVQATDPESAIARFIERKGEGIQHIALLVDDIEKELDNLKAKGMGLIDEKPKEGAHGAKIAFLHPKSTNGVLLELCER
jgi:methylmalonyl-CoA/ethylmalonyl-CoA epimerase